MTNSSPSSKVKPRPAILQALGHRGLPGEIEQGGETFRLSHIFKHDSWAATAIYENEREKIVCKFNRTQPIVFVPMGWLGRRLARREAKMLERLSHIDNVPALRADIEVAGKVVRNAVAHDYIPGNSLKMTPAVDGVFFDEFWKLLYEVHQRGIAYIDLHKAENVLVCEAGRPHLIDFQVSVWLPSAWPWRGILRMLQRMDRYHFARHKIGRCPELCDEETLRLGRRPWFIRLHRTFARPLRQARRRLLVALGVRAPSGKAQTEFAPEESFRRAA